MPGPPLSRRSLLQGTLALAGGCLGGGSRRADGYGGAILGQERMARGHRVWSAPAGSPSGPTERVPILIVGAGVAGLGAAWRLREAGLGELVQIIELGDQLGGTATWGTGARGSYALGAHYLTLPNPENLPVRRLLHALGTITSFSGSSLQSRPRYDPSQLCLAPQERLWVGGAWSDGLWPPTADAEDDRQRAAFDAIVAELSVAIGEDGRPAFAIPTALASQDPRFRQLASLSFAAWLDPQGLTSPALRWWLEYGTRDDYGTLLTDTSAWAGLHYHCARRPDPADDRDLGTHVLTWEQGNGWLVQGLARLAGVPVHTGQLLRALDADTGRALVENAAGELRELVAEQVVLAVPAPVRKRLLPALPGPVPTAAPWRVAALQLRELPEGRGVRTAWDSVVYGNADLGYISSAHQSGRYGGPTVLTWYEALTGDPRSARLPLLGAGLESEQAHVLAALSPSHPDLLDVLERLDLWHWGHGTVRPTVGLHAPGVLAPLGQPHGRVHLAHTDLSGLSLFEEALWHGISAAEQLAADRGQAVESWRTAATI